MGKADGKSIQTKQGTVAGISASGHEPVNGRADEFQGRKYNDHRDHAGKPQLKREQQRRGFFGIGSQ